MGARNRDRFTETDWRAASSTVAQIIRNGWPVYAECQACGVRLWVDLETIAARRGPRTDLWGRTGKCKRVGCVGRTVFFLQPHGAIRTYAMTAGPR